VVGAQAAARREETDVGVGAAAAAQNVALVALEVVPVLRTLRTKVREKEAPLLQGVR